MDSDARRRNNVETGSPRLHRSLEASAGSGSFFGLPRSIRDDIYERVLVVAHPIFLFQETSSAPVETFAPEKPVRWLSLLYTNRQVHNEANAVLYGSNRFTFVDVTQRQVDLLQSFLDCIGSVNASLLSHLCINFPFTERVGGQPEKALLREDGSRSLRLLQEKCINLRTLEAFVYSLNSGLMKAGQDDLHFVRDALSQIDGELKAISSLRKVVIRYYNEPPSPPVTELMEGLGWVILRGR